MRRDLLGNLQTAAIPEVRGNSRRLNGEAILRAGSKIRVRHGKIPEEPLHDFVQCYKLGEGRRGAEYGDSCVPDARLPRCGLRACYSGRPKYPAMARPVIRRTT
jgi:hypothetical protein